MGRLYRLLRRWHRVCDEPVRADRYARHLGSQRRSRFRTGLADPRLVRHRAHWLRHVGQCALRHAATDHRASHRPLSDILLTAANTSGGVVGKAISPQNLAVGAVAVGMMGREGLLFRRVAGWTVLMIAALSLLVYLQSTPVLGWMVP